MNEPLTVLPRLLGGITGLMLTALAATAWPLAHVVAGLTAAGERYVEGRIPDGESEAARMALAGGLLCIITAARRKPHHRWPELAWVASAALALVPGRVIQLATRETADCPRRVG